MAKKTNPKTKTPARGVEHEQLKVFLGKWHAEGDSYAAGQSKKNLRGAVEKWVSDETVEWLPGHFFIVHRWEAMTGQNEFNGIAIISHDTKKGAYMTRSYENHGFIRDYATRVDGHVWTFKGKTERARVEFKDGGNTQKIKWEWRPDGKTWLPLCDRVATRVATRNEQPAINFDRVWSALDRGEAWMFPLGQKQTARIPREMSVVRLIADFFVL